MIKGNRSIPTMKDAAWEAGVAQHVCPAPAKRNYRTVLYVTGSSPEMEPVWHIREG